MYYWPMWLLPWLVETFSQNLTIISELTAIGSHSQPHSDVFLYLILEFWAFSYFWWCFEFSEIQVSGGTYLCHVQYKNCLCCLLVISSLGKFALNYCLVSNLAVFFVPLFSSQSFGIRLFHFMFTTVSVNFSQGIFDAIFIFFWIFSDCMLH